MCSGLPIHLSNIKYIKLFLTTGKKKKENMQLIKTGKDFIRCMDGTHTHENL
jgi:hypothetical protein